eukprot:m.170243 g.170243  ORF g.170243 m.170243 type:complete len:218 (+) comp16684_c0_seq1:2923-3576(+)
MLRKPSAKRAKADADKGQPQDEPTEPIKLILSATFVLEAQPVGKDGQPAEKKPKRLQLSWRNPRLIDMVTALARATIEDGIFIRNTNETHKAHHSRAKQWFVAIAARLSDRYQDDLVAASNAGPGHRVELTGSQVSAAFKRIMASWGKEQSISCFLSGSEDPKYSKPAEQMLEAIKAAFSKWQSFNDSAIAVNQHKPRNDIVKEQHEAALTSASCSQ